MNYNQESIGRLISLLSRYGQIYISKGLKSYNIGSGQYIFIKVLCENDGITTDKLSQMLSIDKGTVTKGIKKLEQNGFVLKELDLDDKRSYKLYATKKAFEVQPYIFGVLKNWTDILSSNLDKDEKKWMLELLIKMSNNAILHVHDNQ